MVSHHTEETYLFDIYKIDRLMQNRFLMEIAAHSLQQEILP